MPRRTNRMRHKQRDAGLLHYIDNLASMLSGTCHRFFHENLLCGELQRSPTQEAHVRCPSWHASLNLPGAPVWTRAPRPVQRTREGVPARACP